MFNARLGYRLLLWLLLPYALFHLLWRSRKQPEYRQHIPERFGFYGLRTQQPLIWLHTVSVGETRAAASLVNALLQNYPDHRILLTHTTPTGRATSEQLFDDRVLRVYLPYDYPFAVQRFLRHFRPRIGILLETEVWPNLIAACQTGSVPLLLLNARLSEKSAKRYARYPQLTRAALCGLNQIAAQTEADAARLRTLGAPNPTVMGNLKFDIAPPATQIEVGAHLRSLYGNRMVFLLASTREGEEALLLDALRNALPPDWLCVLVPRHPQRFDEIAALIAAKGFRYQRRSANQPVSPETAVLLGDSMGEMFAYYASCDLAFIGGSLLPYGSQNLIEAAAVGKPILIGPHTYNFAQAAEQALACGAARSIQSAEDLMQTVRQLAADPETRQKMGQAGLRFVAENQGATQRALTYIQAVINKKAD